MKRTMIVGACLLVLVLIGSPSVMGGQMPMGSHGSAQEQPSGQQPMMGRGMMGMMGMMCPMMGGQMDPSGMMGMMGGGEMDPNGHGEDA
jgi:hypothetical protein